MQRRRCGSWRAYESRHNPATSFSVIRQRSLGESATLCFHLTINGGTYRSFLYPSPDVTGSMEGICVYGRETFEVLQMLFDRIWYRAFPLASGKVLHRDGLDYLAQLVPSITDSAEYKAALAAAI